MRPRIILLLFGFLTAIVSILALLKNSIPESILGSAIGEKLNAVPTSPTLYFVILLALGIVAVIIALMERKVIY